MIFKTFYTRTIFILSVVSVLLFAVLAFINTIFFRNEFEKSFRKLQQARVKKLFSSLDRNFDRGYIPEKVKAKLDSENFEFNIDIFDRDGKWITGSQSYLNKIIAEESSKELNQHPLFRGIAVTFYNPNRDSPFYAAKIHLRFVNSPIFNRIFINFLISGIFVIIVSAIVGWRLVYYLNKRLAKLKSGVSKISQGEFDYKIEITGKDEIAFLARNFNDMAKQIKKLVQSLEESNAARQRLIAHASHEIKSPLTAIKGFIDIIEFGKLLPPEQQDKLLPQVKKDLLRVVKITNDMLQLARIRDPEYQIELKKIDLLAFLMEEHSHFSHRASANNVTAFYECTIPGKIELATDDERLSQVLDNLWSNALKYGNHNFPIRTRVSLDNDIITISIKNHLLNKIQIPPDQLFEPFFRGSNVAEKISGSGLGLAIVKELTEKLSGKIEAKLDDNEIEFCLQFPLLKT